MKEVESIFEVHFLGHEIGITSSIIGQWVVIAIVIVISLLLTRNIKKIPDKKQCVLELLVSGIDGIVKENMGEGYKGFTPFIGTLGIYILVLNLIPLIGFKAPTEDLSVTIGLAIITFLVIQGFTIKKVGLKHYFTGFATPYAALLPVNIIERISLPVSLSLRLFGNITAGAVVLKLLYDALEGLNVFAQFIIPIPLHFYFDMFDGVIQMVIFIMLTMINIKIISEH